MTDEIAGSFAVADALFGSREMFGFGSLRVQDWRMLFDALKKKINL